MTQLLSLTLENYKTFRERERVAIRPITILVGRNSAGKSAIARLPLLLARALGPRAEAPLELEFDGIDFGASFLDLVHNRKPHGAVTIGAKFGLERGFLSLVAKVQHFDEYRLQHVVEFCLRYEDQELIKLEWAGSDPLRHGLQYRDATGESWEVEFQGIYPIKMQGPSSDRKLNKGSFIVTYLRDQIVSSLEDITYLGPFREATRRAYRFPGGTPQTVGSGGVRAPDILAASTTRGNPALAQNVADWFAQNLGGWRLEVLAQGDTFSLVMHHPDLSDVNINLADVGVGISQVLPIVVQRFVPGQHSEAMNHLEIVEQPELHLHPAAHPAIAELYIAAANSGSRVIIETHSENFLLRVRRAVAEKRLSPEAAIIYWIREDASELPRVLPIRIKPDGSVDQWPTGVFSEDFEEVRAIQRAQKGKRG